MIKTYTYTKYSFWIGSLHCWGYEITNQSGIDLMNDPPMKVRRMLFDYMPEKELEEKANKYLLLI